MTFPDSSFVYPELYGINLNLFKIIRYALIFYDSDELQYVVFCPCDFALCQTKSASNSVKIKTKFTLKSKPD